jgi:hypothetical protein
VYLLLPNDADMKLLKAGLDQVSAKEDPSIKEYTCRIGLAALDEIITGMDVLKPE